MELTHNQAMAEVHSYLYRAALATSFGDLTTRDFLTAKADSLQAYADTLEREY